MNDDNNLRIQIWDDISKPLETLERVSGKDLKQYANKYPVQLGGLCDALGIKLVLIDSNLPADIDGRIEYDNSEEFFTIYVNDYCNSYERTMFTLAHELGHYALHMEQLKHGRQFIDRNTKGLSSLPPEDMKMEVEANNFAAGLLMPKAQFTKMFLEVSGNLLNLKDFFGVSMQALEYRAMNLGLIRAV